ncbi:hypothetical protein OEA41_003644 [Lepraria neglecta]|uniref:Uncharacterized protein n=1 Tax=Lepraria neglecta TaxID=209136 RepID=A0AAD9Z4P7_9LECA|nr:hypothetical protein OEA41_003644 [Lepraria neglecta]
MPIAETSEHKKSQVEIDKLKEQLSEAEEDRKSLTKEVDKLNNENSRFMHISTGGRGMLVMAKEFEDLVKERTNLEERPRTLATSLRRLRTHISARNRNELTLENTCLEMGVTSIKLTVG